MKINALLTGLAAAALLAATPAPDASAQSAPSAKALEGTQTLPRRRAYQNLRKSDLIDTRKFRDPAYGARTQGQPFDNGFFFETPTAPHGGTSPYMH